MHKGRLQRARDGKDKDEVIDQAAFRLGENRKKTVKGGTHNISDYSPRGKIWHKFSAWISYRIVN